MALTVQNDAGNIADANAYITVEFFKEYHTERNVTAVVDGQFDDTQISGAIISATDYMDFRWKWKGTPKNEDQSTGFPREEAYDSQDILIEGLPRSLKRACAEYALRALSSALAPDSELVVGGQRISEKTEKVGPIEETTKYDTSASMLALKSYPVADMLVRELVWRSGLRVIR